MGNWRKNYTFKSQKAGMTPPGQVKRAGLKLIKAMYGLNQEGRVWNQALDTMLWSVGFQSTKLEPFVYVNEERATYISVYVDYILVTAPVIEDIDRVIELINKELFPVKVLGEVRDLLGGTIDIQSRTGLREDEPARTRKADLQRSRLSPIR